MSPAPKPTLERNSSSLERVPLCWGHRGVRPSLPSPEPYRTLCRISAPLTPPSRALAGFGRLPREHARQLRGRHPRRRRRHRVWCVSLSPSVSPGRHVRLERARGSANFGAARRARHAVLRAQHGADELLRAARRDARVKTGEQASTLRRSARSTSRRAVLPAARRRRAQ